MIKPKKIKELQLSMNIGQNDLDRRIRQAKTFLEDGHPVRIRLRFKGREVTHAELGWKIMNNVLTQVASVSHQSAPPKHQDKELVAHLTPKMK